MDNLPGWHIPIRYDIIGVTHNPDAQPVEILLRFSPESLPYVLTKPLHPSQKTRKQGGYTLILIKVKPNYELYSVLRSYGKNVEILGPTEIRETFVRELKEAVNLYDGDGGGGSIRHRSARSG